jgi:hypothetical protein
MAVDDAYKFYEGGGLALIKSRVDRELSSLTENDVCAVFIGQP